MNGIHDRRYEGMGPIQHERTNPFFTRLGKAAYTQSTARLVRGPMSIDRPSWYQLSPADYLRMSYYEMVGAEH
jgi:hypothetical protein